jgi:anaerobic dimethyl sulfoxide reductase subunit B (iron-sulfur subunit)
MATYGLLIDYEYCTNCGTCEVSCKEEHGYPVGMWGIKVLGDGPWQIDKDTWNWNWYPVVTDLCDLCADRTAKGREPICVHHCLSNIITYGTVEELAAKMAAKPKQFLIVPQFMPMAARGEFVTKDKAKEHRAAHIAVEGTGKTTFGAHRHDAKVGELDETEQLGL